MPRHRRGPRRTAIMPEGAEPVLDVPRERDRVFVALVRILGAPLSDELTPENVALARKIARQVWPSIGLWMSDKTVLDKVRSKLMQPDVRAALGDAFKAATGFTELDALRKHVEHINGVEYQSTDSEGNVVTLRERPNYQALKDYETMTLPRSPEVRRVQVDSRNLNVTVRSDEPMRVGPPPTRARQLPTISGPTQAEGASSKRSKIEGARGPLFDGDDGPD